MNKPSVPATFPGFTLEGLGSACVHVREVGGRPQKRRQGRKASVDAAWAGLTRTNGLRQLS